MRKIQEQRPFRVACAGAGISYLGVMLSDKFWWLALVLALTMFFLSAFGGLLDTITIEYTYSSGYRYADTGHGE